MLLRRNISAGHFARAGSDRLLYVQDDKLYAQGLDLRRGVLQGEPEPILENVSSALELRHAFFSVSPSGALAWRTGKANATQLTWFDRKGKSLGTAGPLCEPSAVFLSPAEGRLLLTIGDLFSGILEPRQSSYTVLPDVVRGFWMPDGTHILCIASGETTAYWSAISRAAGTEKLRRFRV